MIPHSLVERLPDKFVWEFRHFFPGLPIPIAMPHRICWVATYPGGLDLTVVRIEQGERRFVASFLKPGMTVLDLGAHHGLYATLMSKCVGRSGKVIAFEPSPRERIGLMRHLRLNGCRNVTVVPFAVGSTPGSADFFLVGGGRRGAGRSGANSLRVPQLEGGVVTEKITVPVTTIDRYLGELGVDHVDFVKMDIEGAELDAFAGGEALFRGEHSPTVMVEMSDIVTAYWGYRANEKYDLLRSWGFDWYSISMDGSLSPSPRRERYEGFDNLVAVSESSKRVA